MEGTMVRRDLSEFCEQLGDMQQRFSKMDNCERTIALYYLTIGLPFANARFLQRALEQAITKVSNSESQNLESNANDPLYVNEFLKDSAPVALSKMLCHLPLLRPGNKEALQCYNVALRRILTDELLPNFKIYNECIEILSYVFVHPAFSREDKKFFKQLLNCVSNPNYGSTPSTSTETSSESISKQVEEYFQNCPPSKKESSGSLTPGRKTHVKQDKSLPMLSKPRSFSFSTEQPLQLNPASMQSSSSETRLQDLDLQNSIIMKGVIGWLKSLRLHKYSWLFNNVTFEQMLTFTEESLEALGITKGARNKLILNIGKLKERKATLTELENEVLNGGDLLTALKKLKILSQTPLETSFPDEDLPSQFVRVMGKVCTQMVVLCHPSDECLAIFTEICDRSEQSDTFTEEQKKRLGLWKGHLIQSTSQPPLSIYQSTHHQSNNIHKNSNHKYYGMRAVSTIYNQGYSQKSSSYPNMRASPVVGAHRHSLGSATLQNQLSGLNKQFYGTPITSGNNKNDTLTSFNIVNGFSYNKDKDVSNNFTSSEKFYVHKSSALKSTDIESSLESLCLQMMEHALGP